MDQHKVQNTAEAVSKSKLNNVDQIKAKIT